jgi:choline dehydrogenase-like flavoprotein
MDHQYRAGATASFEGFEDEYYFGGRPNGIYIPRFRNLSEKHPEFIRGYGYQGSAVRPGPERGASMAGVGSAFKNKMSQPGPWQMRIGGFGEVLPYADNYISLNHEKLDINGLPTLNIHCLHRENEKVMREDFKIQAAEMLEAAGGKNASTYDEGDYPGFGIHEMGTARMGRDPKTSVLNQWNQCHDIKNLFITDGSCMTSASCVNPSITYMALTARAVDFASTKMKKMDL